eukprot:c27063_g1_i1 orf=494-2260(+)
MGAELSAEKKMGDRKAGESRQRSLVESVDVLSESEVSEEEELTVSFGYQCRGNLQIESVSEGSFVQSLPSSPVVYRSDAGDAAGWKLSKALGSFSCLSGAALSANNTLANTRICNGFIGEEILPGLDSPRTFRRLQPSSSFWKSKSSSFNSLATSRSSWNSFQRGTFGSDGRFPESTTSPHRIEASSLLNAPDVQAAGGAAGEDRVQAVCSEENGWLFCTIYDGFNGRDAADFLAGTFYENIAFQLRLLEWEMQQRRQDLTTEATQSRNSAREKSTNEIAGKSGTPYSEIGGNGDGGQGHSCISLVCEGHSRANQLVEEPKDTDEVFQQGVLQGLQRALAQTESDFTEMVEQEMDKRPDLAMVGSCVLVVLLHGQVLYTLNLGDSRAVLATGQERGGRDATKFLHAVQLTESHVLEEEKEKQRILAEHPDDPSTIVAGRVKGKLKLTRAFGAGYLKKAKLNDALMGILRVQDLFSPPYISSQPSLNMHKVSKFDRFMVIGSDGLFDFFSNQEVVEYVDRYISEKLSSDPAKYMLEQLLLRAAENAGMTVEQLKDIPSGRRRRYHDDVTIIVIILLGAEYRACSASILF